MTRFVQTLAVSIYYIQCPQLINIVVFVGKDVVFCIEHPGR